MVIKLNKILNPDEEMLDEIDWTQEPTKEEWHQMMGIPMPGSDEERAQAEGEAKSK